MARKVRAEKTMQQPALQCLRMHAWPAPHPRGSGALLPGAEVLAETTSAPSDTEIEERSITPKLDGEWQDNSPSLRAGQA